MYWASVFRFQFCPLERPASLGARAGQGEHPAAPGALAIHRLIRFSGFHRRPGRRLLWTNLPFLPAAPAGWAGSHHLVPLGHLKVTGSHRGPDLSSSRGLTGECVSSASAHSPGFATAPQAQAGSGLHRDLGLPTFPRNVPDTVCVRGLHRRLTGTGISKGSRKSTHPLGVTLG